MGLPSHGGKERRFIQVAAIDGVEFNAICVAQAQNISDYEVVPHLEEAEKLQAVKDLPEDLIFRFENKMLREYFVSRLQCPKQGSKSPRFKQKKNIEI